MPEPTAGRSRSALLTSTLLFVACIAAAGLSAFVLASSARADVDMTGALEKVSSAITGKVGGAQPLATSDNGTYRCSDEYSVVANWFYYFAIGNCRPGWELEVVSYASENSVTHEHSYGGFVNNVFSGCGWIDTRFPLEKLNSNSHSACAGGGSSREFKVEESSFMEKYNGVTVGDGNPVINPRPCPEYANYRPWSTSNVEKELIRTAPEYAASTPGSSYPALQWRYVTKYASTDGSGKYVMVRDARITGAGEGNWVFVPLSCLRSKASELPENTEERNPPPPTATTGNSSNITPSSAVLAGTINPNGLDTHYYIEWGKEASKPYEGFAPEPYPGEDLGSGTGILSRSVTATSLAPNTTYYYRMVAKSSTGQSEGSTQSFKTGETLLAPKSSSWAVENTAGNNINTFYKNTSGQLADEYLLPVVEWQNEVFSASGFEGSRTAIENVPGSNLNVFYRTTGGQLGDEYLSETIGWQNTVFAETSGVEGTPSATEKSDSSNINVFYRTSSGQLDDEHLSLGGKWENTTLLSSGVSGNPAAVENLSGTNINVFYKTTSGRLADEYLVQGVEGWHNRLFTETGSVEGTPSATVNTIGTNINVFYRTGEKLNDEYVVTGSEWANTTLVSSGVSGSPGAVENVPGSNLNVFYRTTGGQLGDEYLSENIGWQNTVFAETGSVEGTPAAVEVANSTNINAFYRTSSDQLVDEYLSAGIGWRNRTLASNMIE